MNEKTKQILRYVACGVGGLALGIGLLGGLAMCASSGNRSTAESVNTILTKKNAQINTGSTGGNYTGYKFEVPSVFPATTGDCISYIYFVTGAYDLVSYTNTATSGLTSYEDYTTILRSQLNTYRPTGTNALRFMASYARVPMDGEAVYLSYYSFLPSTGASETIVPRSFILTSSWTNTLTAINMQTDEYYYLDASNSTSNFYINLSASDYLLKWNGATSAPIEKVVFQDVISYYKTIGYGDGYEQGYTDGDNTGYWAGYNEGIGTASSFTDITANLNAVYDLTPMGVGSATWQNLHGLTDVKIYSLLQFFDNEQDTWDAYIVDGVSNTQPSGTRTMYVDVAQQGSLDYQTIGRAIYNNASTISLQEVSTAHFEFAQIRNVVNRSLSLNLLLLTGWTNDNTAYQAGYQAGLKDGFEGTNTNNVFSLFTSAFNAVGGFFNLKVFGFLPLYWFFLTPLFVALITLLLRMVKH